MQLTRRDAVAALGAVGVGASAAGCTTSDAPDDDAPDDDSSDGDDGPPSGTARASTDALAAVAEVLYPDDVEPTAEFVETYVRGRETVDDGYLEEVAAAYEFVDEAAIERRDEPFASLSTEARDAVLRDVGLHETTPEPEADDGAGHARFYLVDELLYALYSTPTGTERAGIDNPRGHPGGTESYQEAPE